MKLRPFLAPILILTVPGGLLGWLLLAEPPEPPLEKSVAEIAREASRKDGAPDGPAPPPLSGQPSDQASAEAAPLPDDIRNVSPEGVSTPRVHGSLKRIEPSKRYLELKNPPVDAVPDGPIELVRVQVLDAGHIRSEKLTVTLAHIKPLTFDETCQTKLGANWPCGARARTFLRGLIRHLKVNCEKVEELGPRHILGTCKRGSIDLSERMVRYGWADPAPDAPAKYDNLAQTARNKRLGKWQTDWLADEASGNWASNGNSPLPGLEDLAPEIVDWSQPANAEGDADGLVGAEDIEAEDVDGLSDEPDISLDFSPAIPLQ
ncbi:thermonuclease family protein [Roseibium sp.]|uniref:thermonuclease family protein n=1 Tax=Roseibium sp. TaxID=1936156 RepID=UPI003D1239E5